MASFVLNQGARGARVQTNIGSCSSCAIACVIERCSNRKMYGSASTKRQLLDAGPPADNSKMRGLRSARDDWGNSGFRDYKLAEELNRSVSHETYILWP